MIIVSQNKTEIINFEQMSVIAIDKSGQIAVTDNLESDGFINIGAYKNPERAKEVLQEIIFAYKCNIGRPTTIGEISSLSGNYEYGVYEMPEE